MYYNEKSITKHEKIAEKLFCEGYNCAQSVLAAFSDVTGLSVSESARTASAFGGGMCGQRLTCGSVSGMLMALSLIEGYDNPSEYDGKARLYKTGRALVAEFEEVLGSQICSELLKGLKLSKTPSPRTDEYYKVRPCVRFCRVAANILDGYLISEGITVDEAGDGVRE